MSTWYWKNSQDAEPQGPVSARELKQLALSNNLEQSDLVWKQGMKGWVAAHNLKGLFDAPGARPVSNGSAPQRSSRQGASSSTSAVFHSAGMYQKKEQKPDTQTYTNANAYTNTSSFGTQAPLNGSLNGAFGGSDYEMTPAFFSYNGRMRRTTYFLQSLAISFSFAVLMVIVVFAAGGIMAVESLGALAIISLLTIATTVILSFPLVKRLHDLNLSAWFYWISFIPYINVLFSLYVLLARGSEGPNKYGPDPRS